MITDLFVYAIPLRTRFRGITVREGMLVRGPLGWGEFCPFPEYDDREAAGWLATAIEQAVVGWPMPVRDRVAINCIVPAVDPIKAAALVRASGCATAKVKVADHPDSLAEDIARVAAVREALGDDGAVRIDANAAWDVPTAVHHLAELDRAASGLQYAEQPCATIEELALVRAESSVPIAADESIRRAEDPMRVAVAGAADVAVLKCTPLGGVRRSLEVAAAAGLPGVISSALETSVGLSAQLALAGALPSLEFACGLGTLALFDGDLVDNSLLPVDGYLPVPLTPPDPSPALMEKYAHPDSSRTEWWLRRYDRVSALLEK
ncbi:o-succinylbenzoate synthase [Nocardia camponoti]|uniref:o-succinylbenzoate synthase n=1 Tax=Nocardia camponoti TaxID=1616106 RepID=A0A917QK18_9NOCA|nr:o-succinylbenzoate synthase [Nocardia camponoti]